MKFFLSYSKDDENVVNGVFDILGPKVAWLDKVAIDTGEILLEKIEQGIKISSDFVLFWSESASNSDWVKLEVHMAFIRMLEQSGCKLRVIVLDKTPMPLYLKVYKYLDVHADNPRDVSVKIANKLLSDAVKPKAVTRRMFVDRHDEKKLIEKGIENEEIKVIILNGIYGIGKRSLIEKTVETFFTPPEIININVKLGTGWIELTLKLCAIADIEAPADEESLESVKKMAKLSIEKIHETGAIIAFHDVQNWIDEDGYTIPPMTDLIEWFGEIPAISARPIFMATTRFIRFSPAQSKVCQVIRIGALELDDIVNITRLWLEKETGSNKIDKEKLTRICAQLWGYPLGARLAANIVANYGIDYLLENPRETLDLRLDIAKELLSYVKLDENANLIMQALSAIDAHIPSTCLAKGLKMDPTSFNQGVNKAASFNLVTMDGLALMLHPLIRDFFWRRFSLSSNYTEILSKLAKELKIYIEKINKDSSEYAELLPAVFRLIALSGDIAGAQKLRRDLKDTLLATAIQLYNRPKLRTNLELCLKYLDIVLASDSTNWTGRLYKARCLYQLGAFEKAETILLDLRKERPRSSVIEHSLGRLKMEESKWENALVFFKQALDDRTDYIPALRDSAECFLRLDDISNAEKYIQKAKSLNPADPYVLNVDSLILEHKGLFDPAYESMVKASAQEPENANFKYRLGKVLEQKKQLREALELYNEAINIDPGYLDALLSRTNISIDLGILTEAQKDIDKLREELPKPKLHVLRGIQTKLLLAQDDPDGAAAALGLNSDEASFSLRAKIEIRRAEKYNQKGYKELSHECIKKAEDFISEGKNKFPKNKEYSEVEYKIKIIKDQMS